MSSRVIRVGLCKNGSRSRRAFWEGSSAITAFRRRISCKGRARRALTAAEHPVQAVYWEARRIKWVLSTATPRRSRWRSRLGVLLVLPLALPPALEVVVAADLPP